MAKEASTLDLTLGERAPRVTLTRWLYQEIRGAILDGRLKARTRLPATRDFAQQYGVSRGTVVTVFEQLQGEGYLCGKVGAGTWVSGQLQDRQARRVPRPPAVRKFPAPFAGLAIRHPARPFRTHEAAIDKFPIEVWARVASRRLRRLSPSALSGWSDAGYGPLREAVSDYLRLSRAVTCPAERILIVSGVQQGLDLLARVLLKRGDAVWMEDPGYWGAITAFRNAGARIVPVPVDDQGIRVSRGRQLCATAKAAYLTPAHQFPLGATMSLERRLEILAWAQKTGAFLIEDDYDSEYRYGGPPIPALQGLDTSGSVILLGSFNKLLFPSLRLGYIAAPSGLMDPLMAFLFGVEQHSLSLDQIVLTDFIRDGHMARHVRRMRELYGSRGAALEEAARKYLGGLLEIPPVHAGLYATGLLRNGMTSREAEAAVGKKDVEAMALDRFALKRSDAHGLLLGFGMFDEGSIRRGVVALAAALGG